MAWLGFYPINVLLHKMKIVGTNFVSLIKLSKLLARLETSCNGLIVWTDLEEFVFATLWIKNIQNQNLHDHGFYHRDIERFDDG